MERGRAASSPKAAMLFAVLALCLQSLVAAFSAPAEAASRDAASIHSGASPICAPPPSDGDRRAPPCDHARLHCCLPGEGGGDAPGHAAMAPDEPCLRAPHAARAATSSALCRPPRRPPAGWASSWSAQAPPRLS